MRIITKIKMPFLLISLLVVSVTAQQKVEYSFNLAYDYDLYENVLDPELCQQHLEGMSAFEFFDASFRVPQSILKWSTFSLGNYHQCLGINQELEENTPIRGKYCLIETRSIDIPILTGNSWGENVKWLEVNKAWTEENYEKYAIAERNLANLASEDSMRNRVSEIINIANIAPMTLAVCIPRTCTVAEALSPIVDTPFIEFNYTELSCRLPDDKPYSGADIAAVVIFSLIGFLTLLSTGYELHHIFIKKETAKPNELLSCFSVYTNTDKLLTISSKAGALDCLDGIRSLSILWVIVGHTFLVYLGSYLMNGQDLNAWTSTLSAVWLTAANVSVDSFFALSGLLLVYTAANKMKQMQLVKNLHLFYLNRLLRMFPLLAAAVLIQASILHQVSDGVRWDRVAWETQKCRDHWWSALLHIQNIVNPRAICLSHSWYLSVDVQLHILSPLVLFWVLGSRRSAWSGLTAGVLASLTATIVYCFIKEFSGIHDAEYTMYFYHNTMTRSPVFLIGMLFGYMLHVSRGRQVKMPWWVVCTGYVLSILMSGYCLYHVHADWDAQLWITLNTALMRTAWGVSLCWLIYACVNGYAGPVNWFLSWKLWKFTARISYAMYIFHYPMQFVINGANIMPAYFSFESIFLLFASDVAYTLIVSIAACVLIDMPFSTLLRMLMAVIAPQKPAAKPLNQQKDVLETKPAEVNGEPVPKQTEDKQ